MNKIVLGLVLVILVLLLGVIYLYRENMKVKDLNDEVCSAVFFYLEEEMTKEQIQGYTLGVFDSINLLSGAEAKNITLSTAGICPVNATKTYYSIKDITGEDDCIDENNCFIKYIRLWEER